MGLSYFLPERLGLTRKTWFNQKDLVVGCIYRHPSSSISITDFSENRLEPLLNTISLENKQCIIMGDFNVNLLECNTNNAYDLFYNTFLSNNYLPYILQPTRLRAKTLIDNIFFNSDEFKSSSGNLLVEISDHLFQYLIIEDYFKTSKTPKKEIFKRVQR